MRTTLVGIGVSVSMLALLAVGPQPATGGLTVKSGADLQSAIDAALPGETILLEAGTTYVGHFTLPSRSGSDQRPITLRTAGSDAVPVGTRISPAQASQLAKLQSPDGSAVLTTRPGARWWTVELVEFLANRGGANDIIDLGDGSDAQAGREAVPSDLVLDRVYVHGDPALGQKRAIALNSSRTTISNSHISDIKAVGQDSQAIAGWNGPGDYKILNNYIEAAGENVLFGGADPAISDLTPTVILIRGNTIAKQLAWRSGSGGWQVKNLLELKNARQVVIDQNTFERNWAQAQSGYSILLTVRNQDGRCPWCQVEDVRFESNIVRDVAAGIAILGVDNLRPSRQTNKIVIRNNLFDGLDSRQWGGDGYLLQMTDEPRDIVVDRNTVIQGDSGGLAKIDGMVGSFVFTNNIAAHGAYGIIASSQAPGNGSIRANLPGAVIVANVIAGGNRDVYPGGNLFPSVDEMRQQFVNPAGHDFALRSDSQWLRSATDGGRLGADLGKPGPDASGSQTGTAVPRGSKAVPLPPGHRATPGAFN